MFRVRYEDIFILNKRSTDQDEDFTIGVSAIDTIKYSAILFGAIREKPEPHRQYTVTLGEALRSLSLNNIAAARIC